MDDRDDASAACDWISAAEALNLAITTFGTSHAARSFIIRRAGADQIRCRASRMVARADEITIRNGRREIPAAFWETFETSQLVVLEDWQGGDFEWQRRDIYEDYEGIRILGAEFEKSDLLAVLPKPSPDWISADEASTRVYAINGSGATDAIAKRAHVGLVQTRARLFVGEYKGAYGQKLSMRKEYFELPPSFWWAEGHLGLVQDWSAGDFDTYVERGTLRWQAFGVEFDRAGIEAMLAPNKSKDQSDSPVTSIAEPPAIEPPRIKSRALGHNHPYAGARAALELAKLTGADRARLTGPSVGKTMEPYYRATGGKVPHDDPLDEFGASVLRALQEHWQGG